MARCREFRSGRDRARRTGRAPGPDDVRVRQQAAGIRVADLLVTQGVHPERTKAPFVPGWEVLGEVEAGGSDVTGIDVGDRVAGLSIHGGWAEHASCPPRWSSPVPGALEATSAVCLVMDYIVAHIHERPPSELLRIALRAKLERQDAFDETSRDSSPRPNPPFPEDVHHRIDRQRGRRPPSS